MAANVMNSLMLLGLTMSMALSGAHGWDDHKRGRKYHEPGCEGDPHFSGADGSRFDFSGVPNTTYCVLTDGHLNVNAYFGGYYGTYEGRTDKPMTWMREVGIQWGHHNIVLRARQGSDASYQNGYLDSIKVDGETISLAEPGTKATFADGKVSIEWLAAREKSGDEEIDVYSLEIPGALTAIFEIRPEMPHFRTETDGTVHFDIYFPTTTLSNNVHGILGQTYRPDRRQKLSGLKLEYSSALRAYVVPGDNGEGYLDGAVEDYKTSSISTPDSKVNRFVGLSELDTETSEVMEMESAVTSVVGSAATLEMPASGATYRRLKRLRLLKKFKLQ